MEDYPNRIYEWRRRRDVSQEALGKAIGVTKMSMSRMERGLQAITLQQLQDIADQLEVYAADLLPTRDNPNVARDQAERKQLLRYRVADEGQREMLDRVSDAVIPYGAPPGEEAA
ncbi:helix-turn-helix transcriptional regulator [Sphingomonas sp. R-74633]|uniref:helix-turn-helix domain-containing protein n=1 Tax=Sphingomonas sp. R-74633 TaxID=2751188 RepID=UPI0015D2CD7C|nr:helix-turn-helix transcriptional regulator [Sphingomonas sp. R-74633]NYT42299.1 helix-turn-helix transcriptional regulator [Sphingomonas sp. R-74633]